MNLDDFEWKRENEWLETVLNEVRKQTAANLEYNEKVRAEAIETQKELWEEVGAVSIADGLDRLVDFLQVIDAMKRQKRSHGFHEKLREKYEKMMLSPYFGRIDFIEDGEGKAEKYYIGMANLLNDNFDNLVYDWRAPVSGMFYDYETGEAAYKCPEGIIRGDITLKRQYKISDGILRFMFDSNLTIDDEILQEILGQSADSRMKAIVTTIQREQNKVIRNEEYKNLIVQGPAGSGKTSIALHRIAYLLYKYRDKITPRNIIIFSPNEVFNDYISNVLPQLGEDNMLQTTFMEYMQKALGVGLKMENYYDMMEYILTARDKSAYRKRIGNIKYKSSVAFMDILNRYAAYVEKKDRNFTDIVFRGRLIISSGDLRKLFYKDYFYLPLKSRLEKIRARILFLLKPYEKVRIGEVSAGLYDTGGFVDSAELARKSSSIVNEELQDIYAKIDAITEFDLVDIYRKLFENIEMFAERNGSENQEREIGEIKSYTLENLDAGQLYYEDQAPLLYLKGAFGDVPKTSEIKFVIIDEAQDYTPLQYEIFRQLFSQADITMLGDLDQSINPYMNAGDYGNISQLFPRENTCVMNLTKSYRSTFEIAEFTRALLNREAAGESVERHGAKPLVLGFPREEAIKERILRDIRTFQEEGYRSIGIITRTRKEAEEVYGFLKDKVRVKAVTHDDEDYVNGVVIIPAYLAKGLEFDVVVIHNAGDGNYCCEEERLLFYTACTRALHKLCVYYSGTCTPLLRGSGCPA
jgi:DNA helicase-2/ATP-dependent DNA helicase PcrA